MHVLPSLNAELQSNEVLAAALQPLLYMIEESSLEEYTELILPVFRPVFAMPKSVQATVTLLENLDIIIKKTPKSDVKSEVLPMLCAAFDSSTPQIQTSLCLISCVVAEYFHGHPLYFLDIVVHSFILELIKDLITLYLTNRANIKKNKLVVEYKEKNLCEALNIEFQLSISEHVPQTHKKETGKIEYIPIVRSFMVFKTCEALGLRVEYNKETESALKQKKTPPKKEIPIVKSVDVFKLCQALGINAVLAQPGDLNNSI
ncbi:uncharacterized protein TNCT_722721 [Trichonephila clavata]|uniref:Uncharacterized protein n=1 Tax=Trichonephila clavata TaxID=2740835 RepID=A0A8X6M0I1_TRICU|nr:uncharacterized protein TNCT_722721 [Trichonephila clavata]